MMKSISRNKKYVMAGAAIAALTVPQIVVAADAPAQNEEVVTVEMINADGALVFVHVDYVLENLEKYDYKLTQTGFESLTAAGVDFLDSIHPEDIVEVNSGASKDESNGEDESDGELTEEEKEKIDSEIALINETRQNLIKQAISTGDWQPYYGFEYENTPGFFEVTILTDDEGTKTNSYEYNKVFYGSLLESHLRNYNANVANLAYEHGWDNAHASEGEEPGWKDVLDEGHNAYMTSYIEKFNEAPGIVPYVVHLNHTANLAEEYGVEMVADGYFDSEFNSPDLLKGLIASGEVPVPTPDVDEDEVENEDVDENVDEDEVKNEDVDEDKGIIEKSVDFEDKEVVVGEEISFNANDYFKASDGSLKFTVETEGETIEVKEDGSVTFSYDERGEFKVVVKAHNEDFDESAEQTFTVSVVNQGVKLKEGVGNLTFTFATGDESKHIDFNDLFTTDADNDKLTFSTATDFENDPVVTFSDDFSQLEINPISPVLHEFEFTVSDGNGSETTETITIVVIGNPVPTVDPDTPEAIEDEVLEEYKLPQTGSENNGLFAGIGVMLIGLATALGLRRKKQESN